MAHDTPTLTRHRALRYAAPAFAGLLLLGACSKKDDTTATSTQSTTGATSSSGSGSSSDTSVKGTTPGTQKKNQALDQTVWFDGFKISLGEWVYDEEKEDFVVDAVVENLGTDTVIYYGSDLTLQDATTVVTTGQAVETPEILAKAKANTQLRFSISPEKWKPADLAIVFGSGTQSQAKVPLNGDEATTLKPVTQDSIKGALPVGNLTLTPDLAEVRWDDPVAHTQSDKGEAFLIITGKVKNNSPDAVYYFEQKQATLTLPSGEKETADTFTTKDGSSIDGTKSSEFRLVFTVTDPWPGDYTLDFAAAWGTDNTDVTATVSFALVKATTATTGTTPGSTPGTTKK